ncbi:hypothetical protein FPRO06_02917 [Fusarium proliferatum]|uniref:Uncharacterized protein n=1 Tax=Gibberella intermedia TaxID=948311 RepID=A0A365MQL0_GIBIN|nr:hypothetical protein FPRO04_01205 [Fusarium proliferatum]KAG4291031.1 hypothetical protein FPRO06_02917 [Fusarium proliferatum]RBA10829.1 hypothetical protein FPRO05_05418 [Fusarium proliferatum]
MRAHDAMQSEEANDAAWEAARGGVAGAVKWGIGAAVLGAAGVGLTLTADPSWY